ncbi:MAG TPA: hypothetical protein VIH71_08935 [Solirubrobacteraceae bacterium]
MLTAPGSLTSHGFFIQPALHPIEGVLVDQRLVPAAKCLLVRLATLEHDPASEVSVTEYPVQRGRADLL